MYGVMNEYQVSIGESTCPSRVWAAPIGYGGKALLEASELSQIALERCTTALCAVKLMGELAEQYGFYSAQWDGNDLDDTMGEGGEALTVADPTEAWMFHIIPDDTGTSAVWVARRVPDNHVTAVANQFVIREVDPNDSDFLYSSNLWDVAQRLGYWSNTTGQLLDFLTTYGIQRFHPAYATRRVWRILSLAAPSLNLPAETDVWGSDYPFSVAAESPLAVTDIMRILRDHYEGTEFSTAEGVAGGPYGDPNRWDLGNNGNLTYAQEMPGEFPRTISLFRTSYSFVAVARSWVPNMLGHIWLCQYAPVHSSYTPMYVASEKLPLPFIRGAMQRYDEESAWWNFCAVGNYASRFYIFTLPDIQKLQQQLFANISFAQSTLEQRVLLMTRAAAIMDSSGSVVASGQPDGWIAEAVALITEFTTHSGEEISHAWRKFLPYLFETYRDGQIVTTNLTYIIRKSMFYPDWWLTLVGYWNIGGNPTGIFFEPNPASISGSLNENAIEEVSWSSTYFAAVAMILIGFVFGRQSAIKSRRRDYEPIIEKTSV